MPRPSTGRQQNSVRIRGRLNTEPLATYTRQWALEAEPLTGTVTSAGIIETSLMHCYRELMHLSNMYRLFHFVHLNTTEPEKNVAIALGSTVPSTLFNTVSTSQTLLTV